MLHREAYSLASLRDTPLKCERSSEHGTESDQARVSFHCNSETYDSESQESRGKIV